MVASKAKITTNKVVNLLNEVVYQGLIMSRQKLFNGLDKKHDINRECGYVTDISPEDYKQAYLREGIAKRVVTIYPEACFATPPDVYETENPNDNTDFEQDVKDLDRKLNINSYLRSADELSRICYFGLLFIGFDDAKPLDSPAPNMNDRGDYLPLKDKNKRPKVLFMRAIDQTQVVSTEFETNPNHPRFSLPKYYNLFLVDYTAGTTATPSLVQQQVHWSRCIHLADNRMGSPVNGRPALEPVWNRIVDLRKLYGGSAEMFWNAAFAGMAIELDPELIASGADVNTDDMKQQIADYFAGLTRALRLKGAKANMLNSTVAAPDKHLPGQIQNVAFTIGVPLRVFLGSEEAKLASSTDKRSWNERVAERQTLYLTPWVVRPFYDRLIGTGVLRAPKLGPDAYFIDWPDLNQPSDQDKANLAITRTQALVQYVTTGTFMLIPPDLFFTMVLGFSKAESAAIIDSNPDLKGKDMQKFAQSILQFAAKSQATLGVAGDQPKAADGSTKEVKGGQAA
jgi:hypothetical protein